MYVNRHVYLNPSFLNWIIENDKHVPIVHRISVDASPKSGSENTKFNTAHVYYRFALPPQWIFTCYSVLNFSFSFPLYVCGFARTRVFFASGTCAVSLSLSLSLFIYISIVIFQTMLSGFPIAPSGTPGWFRGERSGVP